MDEDTCSKLASRLNSHLQAKSDSFEEGVSSKSQHQDDGSGLAHSLTRLYNLFAILRSDLVWWRILTSIQSGREGVVFISV